MKILIKQQMVAEMRVGLELLIMPKDRPPPVLVLPEDIDPPLAQRLGDFQQAQAGLGAGLTARDAGDVSISRCGKLDTEVIAIIMVKLLQRLDN